MPSPHNPPVWRAAFLRALGLGATVAVASRHAGIGRRTPYELRKKNPLFARLWDEAKARGFKRLQSGKAPPTLKAKPRPVVRIRVGRDGKAQAVPAVEIGWSDEKETKFLEHLSATANVQASADAADVSRTTLYKRRRQWPAFRESWDAAKANAVDRLEFLLIDAATNMLDPPEVPVADLMPVTFDQALAVVQNYARELNKRGETKRYSYRRKPVDVEALKAEILRKIAIIDAAGMRDGASGVDTRPK